MVKQAEWAKKRTSANESDKKKRQDKKKKSGAAAASGDAEDEPSALDQPMTAKDVLIQFVQEDWEKEKDEAKPAAVAAKDRKPGNTMVSKPTTMAQAFPALCKLGLQLEEFMRMAMPLLEVKTAHVALES